jgi:DNA-directed RNA polymerase subunit RPC12/RpoP
MQKGKYDMLIKISVGDSLKCLNCGKEIKLVKVRSDSEAEYIDCPHCNRSWDIHVYHLHGEKYQSAQGE